LARFFSLVTSSHNTTTPSGNAIGANESRVGRNNTATNGNASVYLGDLPTLATVRVVILERDPFFSGESRFSLCLLATGYLFIHRPHLQTRLVLVGTCLQPAMSTFWLKGFNSVGGDPRTGSGVGSQEPLPSVEAVGLELSRRTGEHAANVIDIKQVSVATIKLLNICHT
jgi:hypothetical protein